MTTVNVRYMVDDVEAALDFYTRHLGFTLISKTLPAFADVARGDLRLLLSGPTARPGARCRMAATRLRGGWNRIHLIVDDLAAEVDRLRGAGIHFRNDIVTGPGGRRLSSMTQLAIQLSCFNRGERHKLFDFVCRARPRLVSSTSIG